MNKKVLLSVLSAGLLATTVTPALANENPINGGANKPGAYDQPTVGGGVNDAYNSQTEFVSARTVEEYLSGHAGEIAAEAAKNPAVVAAKKALDAVEGGSHNYTEIKAAYDKAYNDAFLKVRNVYVQKFQKIQNSAKKAERNYYILNETPEQKNARYLKEQGLDPKDGYKVVNKDGKTVIVDKDGKVVKEIKAAKKALPKTHAVK
ncbi:MAG: amylase-binding adhesin AbpA [Gemella haemolysans]|uniref:amylase-binding adhesin AbpA n=1 Tax=Gemella haemolysans TaxID=1379 RepID=UPI003FA1796E